MNEVSLHAGNVMAEGCALCRPERGVDTPAF